MITQSLQLLTTAPSSQLDPTMVDRARQLQGKSPEETVAGLLDILNESACFSLASDFTMVAIEAMAKQICREHALNYDELLRVSYARAPKL